LNLSLCRVIKGHKTPVSDTEDTDDDHDVKGMGHYSHGGYNLTHHHWVDQVVSGGGFNVHCVQAAEAIHKIIMHLASERVRITDPNTTQNEMTKYNCKRVVFNALDKLLHPARPRVTISPSTGLRLPMRVTHHLSGPASLDNHFLHTDIRLTELEFATLVLQEMQLRPCPATFAQFQQLQFQFARRFIRSDGLVLRADSSNVAHRDIYRFKGVDNVTNNALCAEAVCFVNITNLQSVQPEGEDSQTHVLIRWLEPHPDSFERDQLHRPCCPGPFHINHCLWRYAQTPAHRTSLATIAGTRVRISRAFTTQRHIFGASVEDQDECRRQELHAWYGLVQPENIEEITNMCPVFKRGSHMLDSQTWLQTVTMC
jgi:hypothetical protein